MKELVTLLRSRLNRKGIKGLSDEYIKSIIIEFGCENREATPEEKDQMVKRMSNEKQAEQTDMVKQEMDKLFNDVVKPSGSDLVRSQANQMGVSLKSEDINIIADRVKTTTAFQANKIVAVKEAIIAYVNWQHQENRNALEKEMAEVEQFANQKTVEFNNELMGELNNFFRRSSEESESNLNAIVNALSSYR